MAAEHETAIFGAAAAARAAGSAESSGLRRLWADMRIFYIALFASFVGLSHAINHPAVMEGNMKPYYVLEA